jgi:hypothetical protein
MSPEARERSFDELARGLASGTFSRRKAIKFIAATTLGGILGLSGIGTAFAKNKTCAQWCAAVFGASTPAAGRCTSDAAHRTGLCSSCGAATPPSSVCCTRNSSDNCTSYSGARCPCDSSQCLRCDSNTGTCVGCTSDETCLNGSCCPNDQVCGSTCCPSGQTCVNGSCCARDNVCGSTCLAAPCDSSQCLRCDSNTGTCVGCTSDETCLSGSCCATSQVCGTGTSTSCCPEGHECVAGVCCTSNNVSCNADSECCSRNCVNGQCVPCPSGTTPCGTQCCQTGATCVNDTCCPNAQVCGTQCCQTGATCVNGTCCPDARVCGTGTSRTCCPEGRVCVSGVCQCPTGTTLCLGNCVSTSCPPNQFFDPSFCTCCASTGGTCSDRNQCCSGSCSNGTCACSPSGAKCVTSRDCCGDFLDCRDVGGRRACQL